MLGELGVKIQAEAEVERAVRSADLGFNQLGTSVSRTQSSIGSIVCRFAYRKLHLTAASSTHLNVLAQYLYAIAKSTACHPAAGHIISAW